MLNHSLLLNIIFLRLFIFCLFTSSPLFAASSGVICEPVSDLTSGFPGKAFLADSLRACFKPVDDNRADFSPLSANSLPYLLSTVFSAAGSAGVVFPGRPGDVWSHKNQLPGKSPSRASVLKTLLKNRLIPDASFSGGANSRKRNRLEGKLDLAIANWQQLVKRPSYPAAAVSVSDASMRVVITRDDTLRNTSLDSLYEELINIQTQSYLTLLDNEALNEITGIVTGSLVASGSGGDGDDDDNDSTHYSFDAGPESEPLTVVFDDKVYPEPDSVEELIRKNQENKRQLLKILRKKMQQAMAGGDGDLIRILGNRIMLIEADLEQLNELNTSSTGITESGQNSPVGLSLLKASLANDDRELQQRDDDALKQALSQHLADTDYQSILIVSSELTHEEARFFDQWQDTATGLVYQELRRRLQRQLQPEADDKNESTEKNGALVDSLKALVHQFRVMFSADLSSRFYGRQVPRQGDEESNQKQQKTSSSATDEKPVTTDQNTVLGKRKRCDENNGDEGEEPPNKNEHTYSRTIDCPLCHGPCKEEKPEAGAPVALESVGRATAPKDSWILPPAMYGWCGVCDSGIVDSNINLTRLGENTERDYRIYTSNDQVQAKLKKQQEAATKQQQEKVERFEALEADSKNRKNRKNRKNIRLSEQKLLAFKKGIAGKRKSRELIDELTTQSTKGEIQLSMLGYRDRPAMFYTEPGTGSGVAHCIGQRRTMQDDVLCTRFKVQTKTGEVEVKLTGVFDGHGDLGAVASGFAKSELVKHLKKRLEDGNPESLTDLQIFNALKLAFVDTSNSFYPCEDEDNSGGTTANVVLQIDNNLWTANVGDSRAFLLDPEGRVIQLSEDAKPGADRYKKSIVNRGGDVCMNRVQGILGVARSLGDHDFYGLISARPKITKWELPPEGWEGYKLVQACDGLFNVANSDMAGEFVHESATRQVSNAAIAVQLVELAYKAGSLDNLSVIVTSLSSSGQTSAD